MGDSWQLDSRKLAAAKAMFKQLEKDDIIQHSTSPWSSSHGEEGGWELAVLQKFLELNLVTELDVYALTNMLDFATKAARCTVLSKIDLQKGYQIPVKPKDVQKTAFTTPFVQKYRI